MSIKRRRTLITCPLEWQMTAAPVSAPRIPVVAERGGTQLKTPKPVLLVDTREQKPFDCSRFAGWFSGIEGFTPLERSRFCGYQSLRVPRSSITFNQQPATGSTAIS
jgi:hypothetical protein